MRILVVTSGMESERSVRDRLTGHELTFASSLEQAMELMADRFNERNVARLLMEAGYPHQPNASTATSEEWSGYWDAWREATKQSALPFPFDIVITDMMVPMAGCTDPGTHWNRMEDAPFGPVIAHRATTAGARFVAVITDTRKLPGTPGAIIDHLAGSVYGILKFTSEETDNRVMFSPMFFVNDTDQKDWARILAELIA